MTPFLFGLWFGGLLLGWGSAAPLHRLLWSFRLTNEVYACMYGYFWMPCPHCGRHFGGHEWYNRNGHESSIPHNGSMDSGRGICPTCTLDGVGDRAYAALAERLRRERD